MDESSDSDSSADESSVQEDPTPSSPAADAESTLETPSEPSNSRSNAEAPSHPLPTRPMSDAEDVAMVDDENTNQETEQSRRETSEESDDYEPPEPDTGAESPGSAYSPPLSPAPLAILDDTPNQTSQPEQPPDDAFMSAPPMPAWESRPITEILGAPGVRAPIFGNTQYKN